MKILIEGTQKEIQHYIDKLATEKITIATKEILRAEPAEPADGPDPKNITKILKMRDEDGMTYTDIAKELGVSTQTVINRYQKAKR